MNTRLRHVPLVLGLVFAAACQSTDTQHERLQSALDRSSMLSNEITTWRDGMTASSVPMSVVETVNAFKERASDLSEEIGEVADVPVADPQIPAVQQALDNLARFDTDRFETTSPAGRLTLLDQFRNAAMDIRTAVQRARRGTNRT
jgi:hypothetical protein